MKPVNYNLFAVIALCLMHFAASWITSAIAGSDNSVWWYIRIPVYSLEFSAFWGLLYFTFKDKFVRSICAAGFFILIADALDKFAREYGWTIFDTISLIATAIIIYNKFKRRGTR